MKHFLRLLALVGIIGFTALSSQPAEALVACELINGGTCAPNGRHVNCRWMDGSVGACLCNEIWDCV